MIFFLIPVENSGTKILNVPFLWKLPNSSLQSGSSEVELLQISPEPCGAKAYYSLPVCFPPTSHLAHPKAELTSHVEYEIGSGFDKFALMGWRRSFREMFIFDHLLVQYEWWLIKYPPRIILALLYWLIPNCSSPVQLWTIAMMSFLEASVTSCCLRCYI